MSFYGGAMSRNFKLFKLFCFLLIFNDTKVSDVRIAQSEDKGSESS